MSLSGRPAWKVVSESNPVWLGKYMWALPYPYRVPETPPVSLAARLHGPRVPSPAFLAQLALETQQQRQQLQQQHAPALAPDAAGAGAGPPALAPDAALAPDPALAPAASKTTRLRRCVKTTRCDPALAPAAPAACAPMSA